jgi:hypothetical protein
MARYFDIAMEGVAIGAWLLIHMMIKGVGK